MKILSVIKTFKTEHGGPPEVLKNQLEIINMKRKKVYVLKLDMIKIGFLIKCFFFNSYRTKMYNFLKKFDIIHWHEIWNIKIILFVFFANKLLIKHFFVGHGYLDTWSINQKFLKKKLFLKFFLQPAYNSSFASFFSTYDEFLEAKKNLKIHNSFIIPNGVSLNKYKNRNLVYKKKKQILFFGRIHKKKGLDLLLDVIKELPDDYFDEFSFDITGPGLTKDIIKLKKTIKTFSLEKKVTYNSAIYGNDKIQYLNKFDVFLLPSFEEGDSIALKEALSSYLPVIISKQCRLDIIEKYNAGIIIQTNHKSLYDALIKLRSLDIVKMGYQARKLIEDKYDNLSCSDRLNSIYIDVFNETQTSLDWVKE